MIIYKVTRPAYEHDISKMIFKTSDRYWKKSGKPIVYASSSKAMAALEYYHNTSQLHDSSDLVMCGYEVKRNIAVTNLNKSILPARADNDTYYFLIRAAIENWLDNGRTVMIKIPMTFLPGKDILLNPHHDYFQHIEMIYSKKFHPGAKQPVKAPLLEKPDKNARRKYSRLIAYKTDVLFCHPPKQKPVVLNALIKEINKYGLRYRVDNELAQFNQSIGKRLNERLSDSKYVILIITGQLLEKAFGSAELQKALQHQMNTRKHRVIPVIQGTEQLMEDMLRQVPALKHYHCYHWNNNAGEIIQGIVKRTAF